MSRLQEPSKRGLPHCTHARHVACTDPTHDGVSARLDTTRPGIYLLYQTVVLRLPYITSEKRPWSQDQAPANILVPPVYTYVHVCVSYPSSTRLHFTWKPGTKVQTGQRNEISLAPRPPGLKGGRAARREEDSKRSHRARRVVAGIPAADFICRMSTSRGHVRTEPRRGRGGWKGRMCERDERVRG